MYIEQLYTGCLSEAAYYIESEGVAAIIDPIRETEPYLALAESRGATIQYIFETHFHADFVSGHLDLAGKTGATIVYGPNANPAYDVHVAKDGEEFSLGKLKIKVLHTPGHTLESSCYLLRDENGRDHALFSGDTLFVGAVGRPDLAVKSERPLTPEDLGSMMYDSLRDKIMPLADDVIVYPAHGAGSSCGKGIGKETFSTIGVQKATNYALQPMTREEFIAEVTTDLPAPPAYFFDDARINMQGYDNLDEVMGRTVKALSPAEVEAMAAENVLILDTRIPDNFEKGYLPGSWNIGLNGSYAVWVGTIIPIEQPMVVVAEEGKQHESILRLARVGFENVYGYLEGGPEAWKASGRKLDTVQSITAQELRKLEHPTILDVRQPNEYASSHIAGAGSLPLSELESRSSELNPDDTYYVHCAGGYRSMIASSILKAAGLHNIRNVYGGVKAIQEAGFEMESEVPVSA
jgi:glyoxylase-like metal-dependent hydrolase (beta-lactamase superfamily II)/rhodanese-related sulfurtransferase